MTSRVVYKFAIASLLTANATAVLCQQVPQYSMYMLNRYQFNPAYAGMDRSLSINAVYRAQWIDIPGNPVQQNVNAHMPLYVLDGAIGFAINHETIGAEGSLKGQVSYNYVIDAPVGLISMGVAAGFHQKSLDGAKLRAPDGDYEGNIIIHNDDNLPAGRVNGFAPEFSAGVYFSGEYFNAGVSITDYTVGDIELEGATFRGRPALNVFAEYPLDNFESVALYPSVYVKSDFRQTQVEATVMGEYDNSILFGAGVRGYSSSTIDALVLLAGFRISRNLSLAYSFDLTLSNLNRATSGSHEIVLRYNLNKVIGAALPPPVIYSPRFY